MRVRQAVSKGWASAFGSTLGHTLGLYRVSKEGAGGM